MEFVYSQYTINYAKDSIFCFFIKIMSANDSCFICAFDKLKMKERDETML